MSEKQLKVNPNETARLITVNIGDVIQNPYRDMVMFPIQQDKVDSLKESIEKTGFWPSIIARPANNMVNGKEITQEELVALLNDGFDFSGVKWEKAFAHHRQAACEALGFDTIPIVPQIINDENMLLMMANENKEGFGGNVNSQLETVRQVKQRLEESIADFDTFEEYKEAGGDFFKTAKSFSNAQAQGVGFKTIRRFLGETWTERDVRGPVAVLKAIESGYFHQEDIVHVPSIGLLDGIASIATIMYEGYTPNVKDAEPVPPVDWPIYLKDKLINELIQLAVVNGEGRNKDVQVTASQLDKARQALMKDGVNPVSYCVSRGKQPFNVYEALKKEFLVMDDTLESNMKRIDDLRMTDGISDWSGLDEMIERLQKAAKRAAAGEAEEEPGEVTDVTDEGLDPTTEGDLNAALNEGEEGELPTVSEGFGDLPADTVSLPINQMVSSVVGDCSVINAKLGALIERSAEVTPDENYVTAVSDLLSNVAVLAMRTIGKHALTDAFQAATNDATAAQE